ncbi:hypothetical protein MY11210_004766 [Beauveria gryllotalpidicola]
MSFQCVEEYTVAMGWPVKIAFLFIFVFFMTMLPHLHPSKLAMEINVVEFKFWIYLLALIWLQLFVLAMSSSLVQTEADCLRYAIHGAEGDDTLRDVSRTHGK